MSKAESRKENIIKESIAGFLLTDSELFLATKFGELDGKEKNESIKFRTKAMKEFAKDMNEVYTVDSDKLQDIGTQLIAELEVTMNSTLMDLVKALLDNKNKQTKSGKKRKANDEDKPVVTTKNVKKTKIH